MFWVFWGLAMCSVLALLFSLVLMKNGSVIAYYRVLGVLCLALSPPIYTTVRVFHPSKDAIANLMRLAFAWVLLIATMALVAFVTKTSLIYSREVMIQWFAGGYALQAVIFLCLYKVSNHYYAYQKSSRKALIVGSSDIGLMLDRMLTARGQNVVGIVDYGVKETESSQGYPTGLDESAIRGIVSGQHVKSIYIVLPAHEMGKVEELYINLLDENVDIVWIPDIFSLMLINHHVSEIGGIPAIHLNESPLTLYPVSGTVKNIVDKVVALSLLILLSPLLVAVAVAVKQSSPGPILFKQERHGWNGDVFNMLKFRSMKIHDGREVKQAKRNDDRVTLVGRFIRRTSIDELPQLLNVLRGDMSLVGPRPHAVQHNTYFNKKITAYMARHRIKPGMTGLAQVNGERGETDTLDKMERRVRLDIEYINSWSLWLDLKILMKTPFVLLSDNAY